MQSGIRSSRVRPGERRLLTLAIVAAAHLALLWTIQSPQPIKSSSVAREGQGIGLVTLNLSAPIQFRLVNRRAPSHIYKFSTKGSAIVREDAKPSVDPIAHPEDLGLPAPRTDIEPDPLNGEPAPPNVVAVAGLAGPTDPCGLGTALQNAMQANPQVLNALNTIPRASRSVANAIMIWDGQWVVVNALGGEKSLEPVRSAIVQTVRVAPVNCINRINSGPLFISVAGPPATTVLALGSGQWRAADLIAQWPEISGCSPWRWAMWTSMTTTNCATIR
jgi:hypothetical protein